MSGHVGLREEARAAHLLAWRIARLFNPPARPTHRGAGAASRFSPSAVSPATTAAG